MAVVAPSGWSTVAAAEVDAVTSADVGSSTSAEVRVRRQRAVGVYEGDRQADGLTEGVATLTSWAVYFRCPSAANPADSVDIRMPLDAVVDAKSYAGVKFFSSPKIVVSLSGTPHGKPSFTKISFRQGGQAEFLADMKVMLEKKRWREAAAVACGLRAAPSGVQQPPQSGGRGAPVSAPADRREAPPAQTYGATTTTVSAGHEAQTVTDRAGIRGLVDRRDAQYESQQSALRSATADLDELLKNATQVQSIVRSLKASTSTGGDGDDYETRQGIAAPVTREVAGKEESAWQSELASELCAWLLKHPVLKSRPVVPLSELFALYNRGRGAMYALPPHDVLLACTGLEQGSFTQAARAAALKAQAAWLVEKDAFGVVQLRQSHAKQYALAQVAQLLSAGIRGPGRQGNAPSFAARSVIGFSATVEEKVPLLTVDDALPAFRQGVRAAEVAARMHLSVDEALALLEALEDDGVLCRGAPRGLSNGTQRPLFYWNPFTAPGATG